jgi:phage-related protein
MRFVSFTLYSLMKHFWVIHAFQKKSKKGIKIPRPEIDLIRDRLGG